MKLILGLALPWLVLLGFGLRRDSVTHWRYYVGPAIAGIAGLAGVLLTDPVGTPDFWVGFSASLAAMAAAGFILVVEGFLPLSWWTREARSQAPDA